jgi:nitrite reductase/ring-hydroxylating ferredoxin subunit
LIGVRRVDLGRALPAEVRAQFAKNIWRSNTMSWKVIARVTDVEPGAVKACRVGNIPLALYNLDNEFFATHDICTHAQACLSDGYLEDGKIECPLHQGVFDVRTGHAVSGPVDTNIKTFAVRVEGDDVLADLD